MRLSLSLSLALPFLLSSAREEEARTISRILATYRDCHGGEPNKQTKTSRKKERKKE